MAGQLDEATKKRRAAELLALAAQARAARVHSRLGRTTDVLFERRLDDGRWLGHAADHVLVAVEPRSDGISLENEIGQVRIDAVDPEVTDRAVGRIERLVERPRGDVSAA
jgi:tRNA A37 methylthiotransferase MiaB